MTVDKDVYLSLSALDAYNRGYNAKLNVGEDLTGTRLGNAEIELPVDRYGPLYNLKMAAGFYAISYDVSEISSFGATQSVISYRVT
jgi:hypothetical protein